MRKRIGSHVPAWSSSWPVLSLAKTNKKNVQPCLSASCPAEGERKAALASHFRRCGASKNTTKNAERKKNLRYVSNLNSLSTILVRRFEWQTLLRRLSDCTMDFVPAKMEWLGSDVKLSRPSCLAVQGGVRCCGAACRLRLATTGDDKEAFENHMGSMRRRTTLPRASRAAR